MTDLKIVFFILFLSCRKTNENEIHNQNLNTPKNFHIYLTEKIDKISEESFQLASQKLRKIGLNLHPILHSDCFNLGVLKKEKSFFLNEAFDPKKMIQFIENQSQQCQTGIETEIRLHQLRLDILLDFSETQLNHLFQKTSEKSLFNPFSLLKNCRELNYKSCPEVLELNWGEVFTTMLALNQNFYAKEIKRSIQKIISLNDSFEFQLNQSKKKFSQLTENVKSNDLILKLASVSSFLSGNYFFFNIEALKNKNLHSNIFSKKFKNHFDQFWSNETDINSPFTLNEVFQKHKFDFSWKTYFALSRAMLLYPKEKSEFKELFIKTNLYLHKLANDLQQNQPDSIKLNHQTKEQATQFLTSNPIEKWNPDQHLANVSIKKLHQSIGSFLKNLQISCKELEREKPYEAYQRCLNQEILPLTWFSSYFINQTILDEKTILIQSASQQKFQEEAQDHFLIFSQYQNQLEEQVNYYDEELREVFHSKKTISPFQEKLKTSQSLREIMIKVGSGIWPHELILNEFDEKLQNLYKACWSFGYSNPQFPQKQISETSFLTPFRHSPLDMTQILRQTELDLAKEKRKLHAENQNRYHKDAQKALSQKVQSLSPQKKQIRFLTNYFFNLNQLLSLADENELKKIQVQFCQNFNRQLEQFELKLKLFQFNFYLSEEWENSIKNTLKKNFVFIVQHEKFFSTERIKTLRSQLVFLDYIIRNSSRDLKSPLLNHSRQIQNGLKTVFKKLYQKISKFPKKIRQTEQPLIEKQLNFSKTYPDLKRFCQN
jgi:hypothetical protein